MQFVAGQQLVAELAVLRQHQAARVPFWDDDDVVGIAEYHGPGVEGMGADRRHYHAGDVRRHYRPSRRERVGRGTSRRREYEAVGEEEAQYLFSHLHLKVDDAREAAFGDYEVVEGVQFVYEPPAAPDLPLEEPPELQSILPVDDGFYIFLR